MEKQLGGRIDILSYPDGSHHAFSAITVEALRQNGYRAAFSHYDGLNRQADLQPYDIRRCAVEQSSAALFRLQTTLASITGSVWF